MFEPFKSKVKKAVSSVSTVDHSKIIEEIHNEFNSAGEKLLLESLDILANIEMGNIDKAKLLNECGFTSSKEVIEVKKAQGEKAFAEIQARAVQYWSMHYPNNKFITEAQVMVICEKYGLVCGDVDLYTGFVPETKLQQIAEFKLMDDDKICLEVRDGYRYSIKRIPFKSYMKKMEEERGRHLDYTHFNFYGSSNRHYYVEKPPFQICAPVKDMDMRGKEIRNFRVMDIPDPVVLCPVIDGYLILCAWGDEASDPIVVNQKFN